MNNAKKIKIEETNRMEKTYRDFFKRIGAPKGTFHRKMSTRKGRKGKDLIEQKRLRRGGKNTQKNCTKKILMTWITTMM